MRLSLKCLVNVGLALIQGVIVQTERSMQLNDVVNIFLVNDVLNVVSYIPAKGFKEGVNKFSSELSFVISRTPVGFDIAFEALNKSGNLF